MNETYISFYLRENRIHVFADALRAIGSPHFISFMLDETGNKFLMCAYPKKDFHSHRIPTKAYTEKGGIEISSLKLCSILSSTHGWDRDKSYRIPGHILANKKFIIFDLPKAESRGIENNTKNNVHLGNNL